MHIPQSSTDGPVDRHPPAKAGGCLLILKRISMIITKQDQAILITPRLLATYIKDQFTTTHSQRVSMMCGDIARKLGMDKQQIEILQRGALLHDIGKVGIPKNVLTKPDILTEEESVFMEDHPEIGYRLLKPMEFLRESLAIVRHHHEWYDGSGYPHNLKEDEIPFEAAFVSVVDAYDALSNDRPYRKKREHDIAIKTIEKGIGTQFTPYLTEMILSAITAIQTGN